MAANVPEHCHHSMRQLHPRCCCGKWCWQKKQANNNKKKKTVQVSEEEWKAGAAPFSWTGRTHSAFVHRARAAILLHRFGFLLQRLLDQILQRNNSWETDSARMTWTWALRQPLNLNWKCPFHRSWFSCRWAPACPLVSCEHLFLWKIKPWWSFKDGVWVLTAFPEPSRNKRHTKRTFNCFHMQG